MSTVYVDSKEVLVTSDKSEAERKYWELVFNGIQHVTLGWKS